ncbi:alpha/beta hydrolase fold domain-containing protein [Xylanimonas ulmi]|uniref:Acetyl esterase n=1 Tax=Xylanimonas ulmi TaxID=228973 RepID=A0A4Q7M2L1_9MICO|nr:alpha/beta hydrolase fold domain-containing protein [Xylanibacterium ulmi]RZS60698.1 acetyl esterase [Xylanibacterium ulmi]
MTTITALETAFTSTVASDGTQVPILTHRPSTSLGLLVWAHGGSWQHGSAAAWAPVTAALAAHSGWALASVDYRLAPAHRFPAAVLDMLAAIEWAQAHAGNLPIVIGGDSAGGTIAAIAAIARRDAGGPVPPQLLAYPPLDPSCARPSYTAVRGAFPNAAQLRAAWRSWLDTRTPDAPCPPAPLEVPSLAGLGPVVLVVGEDDPVRDDVTAYAERLRTGAVPTTLHLLPGVPHADLLNPAGTVLQAVTAALNEPSAV